MPVKMDNLWVIREALRMGTISFYWSAKNRRFDVIAEAEVYFTSDKERFRLPRGGHWTKLGDAIERFAGEVATSD
jgi:hypothetical protein